MRPKHLLRIGTANAPVPTIGLTVTVSMGATFVPPGDIVDPTRAPSFYDETYECRTSLGVPQA
jgi:hypothetical protein